MVMLTVIAPPGNAPRESLWEIPGLFFCCPTKVGRLIAASHTRMNSGAQLSGQVSKETGLYPNASGFSDFT